MISKMAMELKNGWMEINMKEISTAEKDMEPVDFYGEMEVSM